MHRVLNVPVTEIVLNQPRIRALIGEGVAAGMAEVDTVLRREFEGWFGATADALEARPFAGQV